MRSGHAETYSKKLGGADGLILPQILQGQHHVFNQYVIRSAKRDDLRKYLLEREIGTEIYYPLSLHVQECFSDLGYGEGDFPESERAAAESLAIPMFPYLTDEQKDTVTNAIKEFQHD